MLARARARGLLSMRGEHRVLRVARTVADLACSDTVRARDIGVALALRADLAAPR
jgi:magnesium chelatase family protein